MNIAIVDDAQNEIDNLKSILMDYASIHQLDIKLNCFPSAEKLLADYRPFQYTVIFMDIYMEEMTGIQAAEHIRSVDSDTLLVFLTTSMEHMPDAFRCHAFDYIPKSAGSEQIFRVMDDILKKITVSVPRLTFSSDRKNYSIPYGDIVAIRTSDHYLEITERSGTTYHPRMTFSSVSELLASDNRFLQIIRGVLVNMDYIINFKDGSCYLEGDIHLPINVRNKQKIEQIWKNYVFNKIRHESAERRSDV